MYEPARNLLLRFLKVPPEPHPPFGDPASLRVFRAGRNYYRLRLFGWAVAQVIALAGILFWAAVLIQVEADAHARRPERGAGAATAAPAPTAVPPPAGTPAPAVAAAEHPPARGEAASGAARFKNAVKAAVDSARKNPRASGWAGFKQVLVEVARVLPAWAFPLIWVLKIVGFAVYLVQIPITYAVRRLDYEMHWYVVTDRSLRLRTGVWNVQELTMSFANLQQVVVTQGPLQRLLGLGDVLVQSAGGGAAGEHGRAAQQNSMHAGHFHSVANAVEIRDLILERLRRFRESGLGDPEEARRAAGAAAPPPAPGPDAGLLAAARELRDEASALRLALG